MIKPLGNRIAITKLSQDNKTSSGIILNDNNKHSEWIVTSVGEKTSIKVGDRVAFFDAMATEVTVRESTVFIIKEDEILGVIE